MDAHPPPTRRADRRGPGLAGPLLLAALLAPLGLPLLGAPAAAQAPVVLEYTVDASSGSLLEQGKVQITWRASGFRGRISAFCLQVDAHEYRVDVGSFGPQKPRGPWEYHPSEVHAGQGKPACPSGFRALVKDADEVEATFQLDVRRPAFSPCGCEFNAYLGPSWGVLKAEALAVPFSYAFFEPQPEFQASVRFLLPDGWAAEAPWTRAGPLTFALPGDGAPLPRGFVALGRFDPEVHRVEATGKEFVYARLAGELKDRDTLFAYLEKATPYYQSVYGNATGRRIVVISAGAPMFTGGLGSTDSLFVHQNSTRETIAHEYAHVWQRFQTLDRPGVSSVWVNEGDADLHGALSRFVTETQPGFTMEALNREFRDEYDRHAGDEAFQQPLTAATYGGQHEQVAYKKGLFTLLYLDQELRRITNGTARLNDVLRELNRAWEEEASQRPGEKRMGNEDVLAVVNRVVQRHAPVDMLEFFRAFVWGNSSRPCGAGCWPPYVEVPPEVPIVFDGLRVEPREVAPDGTLTVTATATNVRASVQRRSVELLLDGEAVRRLDIEVGPLATVPVRFTVAAPEPGPHEARIAYLREEFRVLTPPDLVVQAVEPRERPQAGVAFDLEVEVRNDGEASTVATVDVALGEARRSGETRVPGKGVGRVALPFLVPEEGEVGAEVLVQWGQRSSTASALVAVGPRDRDGDGVPDARDAYPDDPRFWEANAVNDLRRQVPGPGAAVLAAGLAVVAVLAGRGRGRRSR